MEGMTNDEAAECYADIRVACDKLQVDMSGKPSAVLTKPPESKKKPTVLVIDDEVQMRRLLRVCLEMNSYDVAEAETGKAGIEQAVKCQPDLILLDMGLPDMDGLSVLKRLREWSQVPICIVSVRNQEDDKVAALDNGANDYLTKPFGTGELLARLRVMQRLAQPQPKLEVFQSGRLSVDLPGRTVKVDGNIVRLTATEYSLLVLFIQHAGKALTHGQILREVWGVQESDKTGPLRVYIGYLRDKLEANPGQPELIITEPGVGYRLMVKE
jgi:two-component system KDP operon response regulator KdpE